MGKATGKINLETFSELKYPTQYFWFESNSSATVGGGAHITNISEPAFRTESAKWDDSSPEYDPFAGGTNLLMGSSGLNVRDGSIVLMDLDDDSLDFFIKDDNNIGDTKRVAQFGENTTIGEDNKYNIKLSGNNGLTINNGNFSNFTATESELKSSISGYGDVFKVCYKNDYPSVTDEFTVTNIGSSTNYATVTTSKEVPRQSPIEIRFQVILSTYEEDQIDFPIQIYEIPAEGEISPVAIADISWNQRSGWSGTTIPSGSLRCGYTISNTNRNALEYYFQVTSGSISIAKAKIKIIYKDTTVSKTNQVYLRVGTGTEISSGLYSATIGENNTSSGKYSCAIGIGNIASGESSLAVGTNTISSGIYSFAEGYNTKAIGSGSHAEGSGTTASGSPSHAEGFTTKASGNYSHSEGYLSEATGSFSHAEGISTKASGSGAHSEGYNAGDGVIASGIGSHAEGYSQGGRSIKATGNGAHAEGCSSLSTDILASGNASHAEGSGTTASMFAAHAEGDRTTAAGNASHAEGQLTTAEGACAHAEGQNCIADGHTAHAGGYYSEAVAYAYAHGYGVIADKENGYVIGSYNAYDPGMSDSSDVANYLFTVGNGTGSTTAQRSNAFTVDWSGNVWAKGNIISNNRTNDSTYLMENYIGSTVSCNANIASSISTTHTSVFETITGAADTSSTYYKGSTYRTVGPGTYIVTGLVRFNNVVSGKRYGVGLRYSTNGGTSYTTYDLVRDVRFANGTTTMSIPICATIPITTETRFALGYLNSGSFTFDGVWLRITRIS